MAQDISSPQPKAQDLVQAPYRQHPNGPSGHYMIRFNKHYDIKQHFKFVDRDFPCQTYHISSQVFGYHADLDDDELVRLVRSDPGVKEIEDDYGETLSHHSLDTKREHGRQTAPIVPIEGYKALYRRSSEGPTGRYLVFFQPGHSISEHFRIVGRGFALWEWQIMNGYCARMDDELLALVRRDSGVKMVEDDLVSDFIPIASLKNTLSNTSMEVNAAAEPQLPNYDQRVGGWPDGFNVYFRPGYTIDKHFRFLGFKYADRNFVKDHPSGIYRLPGFAGEIWDSSKYSGRFYRVLDLEEGQFMALMRDSGISHLETMSDGVDYDSAEERDYSVGIGLFD